MSGTKRNGKKGRAWVYIVSISIVTFVLASFLTMNSQMILNGLQSAYLAFVLLIAVILVGILFDIVGVAVAAANDVALNAKAACRINGATEALALLRNADRVANICCDVAGDICGTVSGGIGAAIVFSLPWGQDPQTAVLTTAVMTGIIAAITVGGKSVSKAFAINESDKILFFVGRIIHFLSSLAHRKNPNRQEKNSNAKPCKKRK